MCPVTRSASLSSSLIRLHQGTDSSLSVESVAPTHAYKDPSLSRGARERASLRLTESTVDSAPRHESSPVTPLQGNSRQRREREQAELQVGSGEGAESPQSMLEALLTPSSTARSGAFGSHSEADQELADRSFSLEACAGVFYTPFAKAKPAAPGCWLGD